MIFLRIEVSVDLRLSSPSRFIWGTSRLEPWLSSATSGCSNMICWSCPLTSALREATLPAEHCVRGGRRPQPCLTPSSPPGQHFLCREFSLSLSLSLLLVDCSRWLIPGMIPGASQLFKSLLTLGDNPVKAVKDHVRRRRGRQKGCVQGQTKCCSLAPSGGDWKPTPQKSYTQQS